jgi:hypothetical protein
MHKMARGMIPEEYGKKNTQKNTRGRRDAPVLPGEAPTL